MPEIVGLNHVTLSVSDVERSFEFYTKVLGMRPRLKWADGAYLSAGTLWLALHKDAHTRSAPLREYTHLAFSVSREDFAAFVEKLVVAGASEWKKNSSFGASHYFLDPDGHKLELHASNLAERLHDARARQWAQFTVLDDE